MSETKWPVSRQELEHLLGIARETAGRAGALVMEGYRQTTEVHHKGVVDLVTDFDLRSEQLILEELRQACPEIRRVAEESDGPEATHTAGGLTWYVDPIDGTTNFVHGHPFFCISIGLCLDARPLAGVVLAPALGRCWTGIVGAGCWRDDESCEVSSRARLIDSMVATGFPADRVTSPHNNFAEFVHVKTRVRALRRCGSAALDLAFVADGTYDAFWEYKLAPWDTAAGAALVLAAGGACAQMDGGPHDVRRGELVASNGLVHDALIGLLAKARRHPPLGLRE